MLLIFLSGLLTTSPAVAQKRIALTFDDVPRAELVRWNEEGEIARLFNARVLHQDVTSPAESGQ